MGVGVAADDRPRLDDPDGLPEAVAQRPVGQRPIGRRAIAQRPIA
ncbi:hypothetical protein AB0K48_41710 [Nonomuraea sp. NPDC055795]